MLVVKAYAGDRLLLADSGLIRQIQSGWFASLAVAPSAEVRAFCAVYLSQPGEGYLQNLQNLVS